MTLLLIKDDPTVLHYMRVIIDFVHITQYKSHINKTLQYIENAFYWINQTKEAFRDACQIDTMIWAGKSSHFNFSKWHVMSYYPEWIKYYRSTTGFITGIREAMHIT